jgi:hypothetical protein
VPITLALLVLAVLYVARWSFLEEPIRSALDATLENAIGSDVELQVGRVRGPLFTGITVSHLETIHPATSGFVRGVDLRDLSVEYRLVELLPLLSASVAPWFPVSGPDPEWLFAEELDTARLVAHLHEVWPEGIAARASGEIVVRSEWGWARPEVTIELRSPSSDSTAELVVRLSGLDRGEAIPDSLELRTAASRLVVDPDRLAIEAQLNDGDLATIDASIEARDRRHDAPATLAGATVNAQAPGLMVTASGSVQRLQVNVDVEQDEPFLEKLLSILSPDLGARVGSLAVSVEAAPAGAANVSLLDTLVDRPSDLPQVAIVTGAVRGSDWRIDSLALDDLSAELRWSDKALTVTGVAVEGTLVGSMFDQQNERSASIELAAREISYDVAAERLALERFRFTGGSAQLRASGELDLTGYESASWSEASGSIDGRLRIENPTRVVGLLKATGVLSEDVPLRFEEDASMQVSFDLEGHESGFQAAVAPSLRGMTIGSISVASLQMRGTVEGSRGSVSRLEAIVEDQAVRLFEPVEFSWAEDLVVIDGLRLRAGEATLETSLEIGMQSLAAEASVSRLPVEMIASMLDAPDGESYAGDLSAEVSVSGTPAQPLAEVEVRSSGLIVDGAEGEVLVVARQDASGVVLDELSVELGEVARARGSGKIPFVLSSEGVTVTDLGAADLNLVAFVALARVLPDLEFEPWTNAVVRTEIDVEGEGGSASVLVTEIDSPGQLALAGVDPFRRVRIDASTDSLLGPTIVVEGVVSGDETEVATFAATVPTALDASPSDLTVDADLDVPLGRLSHLVPGLSLLGGSVAGEVSVNGAADGVRAAGELTIEDALVKLAAGVPTISAMNGRITFSERQATIAELSGRMGQGQISVTGSVALPESSDFETSLPAVDITVEGDGVLLARTPDVVARGDLDLSIDSQPESVRVTGRFDATEVLYTKSVQLLSLGSDAETPGSGIELFYVDAPWARSVSLNIRIVADETVLVENNLYEGRLSADLRIRGTAAVPRPEGRVFATDGVVTLPTATLNIQQLRVRFPPDSALNPSVFARAQADAQGYEMSVTVDGQFPNVEVDVASSPPLPTDQALVLLATGQEPSQLTFGGEGGTLEAAGTVLGRSLISELAGSVSGDGGGFFERLQFDIERDAESDLIGNLEVEYQFAEGEPWYLLIERVQAEEYTVQLSWRLWAD